MGKTFAVFQEQGKTPEEKERWKRFLSGFAIEAAMFLRTIAGIPSGPADLFLSKFRRIL